MPGIINMGSDNQLQSWLALHLVPGLGPVTCHKLVARFGSPDRVLSASVAELNAVCRLRQESVAALDSKTRENLRMLASDQIEQAAARNISIVTINDPRYPSLLHKIHDPPVVLYILGNPALIDCNGIGIVGSRAATHYGKNIAQQLASGLARQGFTIISGMALGIDTAAHKGALAAREERTIAVLGCGLDIIYPPSNRKLYAEIAASGAVVSEYPLGTIPDNFRFPARNRIISGLSLGVVVVEAAKRSGSLITVQHALEQGREVFAVPGRIDSVKSAGTHALLHQGAKLVHSVNDIVEEFSHFTLSSSQEEKTCTTGEEQNLLQLNHEEAKLLACLDVYPQAFDEIVSASGFTSQKTNELLLYLEIKGVVKQMPGKCYQRAARISGK